MHLILNQTMLTTFDNYQVTWTTLSYYFRETVLESYFGLTILLTSFGLPLVLTWLTYPRLMASVVQKIKPFLSASIFRTYHDRPLPHLLGNVPTVGQSFYITVVVVLNIVFLSVGYKTLYPDQVMQWYQNHYQELMAYWMWRTGVLAFCNMPVLFLFSSRNNILLWLTDWSHSTFMLFHRWIARIFLLQTLLHSIIALVLYVDTGSYATSLKTLWWIWGCVATIAAVIIVLTSLLVFRQRAYELFLLTHITMSVVLVAGCWYHVWYEYENTFGYETWLYATIAVWFFDRLVRVARIFSNGLQRAQVTDIGPNIVRVDVPDIRWAEAGRCVYAFFPSLSPFRPWENHPFSTIPTRLLNRDGGVGLPRIEHEKDSATTVDYKEIHTVNSGLTLFIRKNKGVTSCLSSCEKLPVFLDGPYPTNSTRLTLKSDRLLLFGGGIGITGLLPFIHRHQNLKLCYSVKAADQGLLDALSGVLESVDKKEIAISKRLDLNYLLSKEVEIGWSKIGVVVCGPAGMCDDIRAIVAELSRSEGCRCSFELEVDAFSW